MKNLNCYYCNQETTKAVLLYTFYTKECYYCDVTYHLDRSDKVTLITLNGVGEYKYYYFAYNPDTNKISVCKRRDKFIWEGNSASIFPIKIAEFDGDYNTINPTNMERKLKTILTFL